jgi:hypothetical protein
MWSGFPSDQPPTLTQPIGPYPMDGIPLSKPYFKLHNNDNLDNNPSPNRTHPSRIVCLFMFVLHVFLVIFHVCVPLLVDARPRGIEDVREPDEVQKTGTGDTRIKKRI